MGLMLSYQALALEAWFDHKVFQTAQGEAFVETYLSITGTSVFYDVQEDSTRQARIGCTLIIRRDSTIVDFRKVNIAGPAVSTADRPDFMDVQRFILPEGDYTFDITLIDQQRTTDEVTFQKGFDVFAETERPSVSDLFLIRAFAPTQSENDLSKSGMDLLPYLSTYYPQRMDVLMFYAELYGTQAYFGDSGKFLLDCFLMDQKDSVVVNFARRMKREKAAPVVPVVETLDISAVPSGDYTLVVEIRDRENRLVASESLEILRSNRLEQPSAKELSSIDPTRTFASHFTQRDSLLFYLDALQPIASHVERITIQNLLQEADLLTMQQYFYYFWARRDEVYAQDIWERYQREVLKAEQLYGTRIKHGFETDMGRIFLKWGPPNSVGKRHQDIFAYPYEIWHYYELGDRFRNKRFVFWNQDLIGEEFILLHSDVPGETSNEQWKSLILSRQPNQGLGGADADKSSALLLLEQMYINP